MTTLLDYISYLLVVQPFLFLDEHPGIFFGALLISFGWLALGGFLHGIPIQGIKPKLIFAGPLFLAMAPITIPMAALSVILTAFAVQWLLDPRRFWIALLLILIVWTRWRSSASRFKKAIAKTLQPWLIGMASVGAIYLAAYAFLGRAEWSWIFFVEKATNWCERLLTAILPESLFVNLGLLLIFFVINLLGPAWKKWSGRVQSGITATKSALEVLAVFTSFTFFGAGQAGILLNATAQEKYDRLKEQSVARAQLILAARVSKDTKAEAQTVTQFLDSVRQGVLIDLKLEGFLPDTSASKSPISESGDRFSLDFRREFERQAKEHYRERLKSLVESRVSELHEAMAKSPIVGQMASLIDKTKLASMFDHKFTDDEIRDAKEQFEKGVDKFVESGANITFDPLSKMLEEEGISGLLQSIVKDLYKSELNHLAKDLSGPLADSLFSGIPGSTNAAVAKVATVVDRPIFDPKSLPAKIVKPSFEGRLKEIQERDIVERAVKEAVKRPK